MRDTVNAKNRNWIGDIKVSEATSHTWEKQTILISRPLTDARFKK